MNTSKDNAYEKRLLNIFKVISWLDHKRWNQEEWIDVLPIKFVEEVITPDLQPSQKILIHWLIYVTNRVKQADTIWERNTDSIKNLVVSYSADGWSEKDIARLCKKHENDIKGLPADLESIKRTLILLLEYDKDIIGFITRKLSQWDSKCSKKVCARIAFSLYLLSYKGVGSLAKSKKGRRKEQDGLNKAMDDAKQVLSNNVEFEKQFERWHGRRWHKRIWAALRDYTKCEPLREIFIEGMADTEKKKIWREGFNKQLELPGDIWNARFFQRCIEPITEAMAVNGKGASKVVRELWEKIKCKCPESYPEQFDVSFDFAPRMCAKNLCAICPFGPNGAEDICIPTQDKCCPVALTSCGYVVKCSSEQGECILKDGIGKGACENS
ncbi:MAG: hypothetical protein KAR47_21935 [Planctomycetes bacterium]|nr:hypothetical protein [Planctomycetota bacterium]